MNRGKRFLECLLVSVDGREEIVWVRKRGRTILLAVDNREFEVHPKYDRQGVEGWLWELRHSLGARVELLRTNYDPMSNHYDTQPGQEGG